MCQLFCFVQINKHMSKEKGRGQSVIREKSFIQAKQTAYVSLFYYSK